MDKIITELHSIASRLDRLYSSAFDLSEEYYGNQFENQNEIASQIENLLIGATHETATSIGFMLQDIKDRINLFALRKKYTHLSDYDFQEIIDSENLSLYLKKNLKCKLGEQYLEIMRSIKNEWFELFKNKKYKSFFK